MTATAVNTFRILVVDDEEHIHKFVRESLSEYGPDLRVDTVKDLAEAAENLARSFYDLVVLDLYGDGDLRIGFEVLREINAKNLSTPVLLMTAFNLKDDAAQLLHLAASPSATRLTGFLNKNQNFAFGLKSEVGKQYARFRRSAAYIEGLDTAAEQVRRQRYRYGGSGRASLRADREEIATEVDRLIRHLFVELPGGVERKSGLTVRLTPMERNGLSAAVVLNATVDVTFDVLEQRVGGQKTVLKIGPKADILEEAARFSEYVRYGVELAQRVELLSVAQADALGGLVYSFAGGLYANELLPLDEVLVEDLGTGDLTLSTTVLERLFSSKHWYSVRTDPMDVGDYFADNFRTNLVRSIETGEKELLKLSEKGGSGTPTIRIVEEGHRRRLDISTSSGAAMHIPAAEVLGWGLLLHPVPASLVHGDMHGGNVLLECSTGPDGTGRVYERTCLIDFRNAGPGPRCVDAVCLEASIRLAEVECVRRERMADASRKTPVPPDLATEMVDRFGTELQLYRAVFLDDGTVPDTDWARLSATVLRGLRQAFPDVTLQEYLSTSLRYTFRSLGFPRQTDLFRYRLAGWLAAQYELAQELDRR